MTERFLLDPESVLLPADAEWTERLGLETRPLHVEIGFGKDTETRHRTWAQNLGTALKNSTQH